MSGYSEVIQVIGAMIIFSMILLNANSMILRNTALQIDGEIEQEVIALAQEIIEEAMTKSFDHVTVNAQAPPSQIPEGFSDSGLLGPDAGETSRPDFDDFDDYNNWSDNTIETEHESFSLEAEVYYVDPDTFQKTTSHSTFKKIEVRVTNEHLTRSDGSAVEYRLEFIRNYYAD